MTITKTTSAKDIAKYLHEQGMSPCDVVEFGKSIAQYAGDFATSAPKAQTLENIRDVLAKLALITGKSDAYSHIDAVLVEYNVETYSARLDADDLLHVHGTDDYYKLDDYFDRERQGVDPDGTDDALTYRVEYSPVTHDDPNDTVLELRRELAKLMALLPHPYGLYGVAYD